MTKVRLITLFASSLLALTAAVPASAAVTVVGPAATAGSCADATFTNISASACAGGYDGNLLKGSPQDGTGLAALQALGYTGDGTFIQKLENLTGNDVDFTALLTGTTYIGIHYGNGSGIGNATSFFRFDAGSGVDVFQFTRNGLSNAVLFQTGGAVPEPGTWAMMLVGFGAVGYSMRRRKRPALAAAA